MPAITERTPDGRVNQTYRMTDASREELRALALDDLRSMSRELEWLIAQERDRREATSQ